LSETANTRSIGAQPIPLPIGTILNGENKWRLQVHRKRRTKSNRAPSLRCAMRCWVGPIRTANAGPPAERVAGRSGRRIVALTGEQAHSRAKPASRRIPAPASASPNQLAGCPKRWWARTRLRRVCPTLHFALAANLAPTRCRVGPIRAANAGPPAEDMAKKFGRKSLAQTSELANPRANWRAGESSLEPARRQIHLPADPNVGGPAHGCAVFVPPYVRRESESCSDAQPAVGWDQFAQRMQAHQRKAWPGKRGRKNLAQNQRTGESSRKPAHRQIHLPATPNAGGPAPGCAVFVPPYVRNMVLL
jgi:hypothetical protein